MTDTTRYVNCSSSGGDGTTNNEAGATAAFASLSAAESALQGTINVGDLIIIECSAGSALNADTTAINFSGWTINGALLVRGNRGDAAGFYAGDDVISSSHYRISLSTGTCIILSNPNITVDGLQLENSTTSSFQGGINCGNTNKLVVRNCRVLLAGNTVNARFGMGTFGSAAGASVTRTFESNLVVINNGGVCIQHSNANFFSPTVSVINNSCYGGHTGIDMLRGASGNPTFTVVNNAVAGTLTSDIADTGSGGTFTRTNNFTEDAAGGDSSIGPLSDAWTAHGVTAGSQFTVKDTSSSLYHSGTATGAPSTDIRDEARNNPPSVGAYELVVVGGGGTVIPIFVYNYRRRRV